MPNSCTQRRCWLVTHSTLDFGAGIVTPRGKEWVTGACDIPLFDARSKAIGKCPACEGGWKSPNNYPIAEEVTSP